jgi:hypothetical protein
MSRVTAAVAVVRCRGDFYFGVKLGDSAPTREVGLHWHAVQ